MDPRHPGDQIQTRLAACFLQGQTGEHSTFQKFHSHKTGIEGEVWMLETEG